MPKRKTPMTPAWEAYWSDPRAPHPEAIHYAQRSLGKAKRVISPMSYTGSPSSTASFRFKQESWYCHHYRATDEHYHKTLEELEGCKR